MPMVIMENQITSEISSESVQVDVGVGGEGQVQIISEQQNSTSLSQTTNTMDEVDIYDDPIKSIQAQIVNMIEVIEQTRLAQLPEEEIDGLIAHLEDLIVIASVINSFESESPSDGEPKIAEFQMEMEPNILNESPEIINLSSSSNEENSTLEIMEITNDSSISSSSVDTDEAPPPSYEEARKANNESLITNPQNQKTKGEIIMENIPVFNTGYNLARSVVHLSKNEKKQSLDALLNALKSGAVTSAIAISLIMPLTASGVLASALIGGTIEATTHGVVDSYKLIKDKPDGVSIKSDEKEEIVYNSINRIPGIGLLYGLGRSIHYRKDKQQLKNTAIGMSFNLISTALTGFAIRRAWVRNSSLLRAEQAALTDVEKVAIKKGVEKGAEKSVVAVEEESSKWVEAGTRIVSKSVESGVNEIRKLKLGEALSNLFSQFIQTVTDKILTLQNIMEFQETLVHIMMCISIEYSNNSEEITVEKIDEIVNRELAKMPLVNFCYNLLKVIYLSFISNNDSVQKIIEDGKENIQKSISRLCDNHINGTNCGTTCTPEPVNYENRLLIDEIRSQIVNRVFNVLRSYNNP